MVALHHPMVWVGPVGHGFPLEQMLQAAQALTALALNFVSGADTRATRWSRYLLFILAEQD